MEDFKKKFILLSKVAKEKKYAQEYLGLLARRGDIGSIRIGKRWYTTWTWFEEFLASSQKKKTEPSFASSDDKTLVGEEEKIPFLIPAKLEEKVPEAVEENKIEIKEKEKISLPEIIELPPVNIPASQFAAASVEVKIISKVSATPEPVRQFPGTSLFIERKEEDASKVAVKVMSPAPKISEWKPTQNVVARKPESMASPVPVRNFQKIPIRQRPQNIFSAKKINQRLVQSMPIIKKAKSVVQRDNQAVSTPEIKPRKNDGVFSPDISFEKEAAAPLFSRFAFAMSFAIILLLVAASGYLVYTGGLLKSGRVAGASDERNGEFSSIKSGSGYIFSSVGDKIKESVSVSRIIIEAAREKTDGQQKVTKP